MCNANTQCDGGSKCCCAIADGWSNECVTWTCCVDSESTCGQPQWGIRRCVRRAHSSAATDAEIELPPHTTADRAPGHLSGTLGSMGAETIQQL